MHSDVWNSGYDSGFYGHPKGCCPYGIFDSRHWDWMDGWRAGRSWTKGLE